jgi:hypothetical protein
LQSAGRLAIRKTVQGLIDIPSSAMIGTSSQGAAVELTGILRYTGLSRSLARPQSGYVRRGWAGAILADHKEHA